MKDLQRVIKKPCLNEKSNLLHEQQETVAFKVDPRANKLEIKEAVEKFFKVKVDKVRTCHMPGKEKRVGTNIGQRSGWKKAVVTLAEGHKIDFLENL